MRWGLIAALVVAAAASIFNVILLFQLENLLRPMSPAMNSTMLGAIGVILILTIGAIAMVWRVKNPTVWAVVAISLVLVAGLAPRVLDAVEKEEVQATREEEDRRIELKLKSEIEMRKRDVEERISAQRPYSPVEALAFVEFVGDSDLSYRSLSDHLNVTFALLQRALEAKIVDPNGMVKGAAGRRD